MIPGPDLIRACPHCGALLRERTLASGNTFGGTFWCDGKEDYPMLPLSPPLVLCARCDAPYWLDEAEQVGESWGDDEPPEWRGAPYAEFPPARAYRDALAIGLGDTLDRERTLRLGWWQAFNDPYRGSDGEPPEPDALLRANLTRLGRLLRDSVLRAEVARAQGAFESARAHLRSARTDPRLDPTVLDQLDRLIADGSRRVVSISAIG